MMSCKMFNVLDSIAKSARGNSTPFGGIQIILLGIWKIWKNLNNIGFLK